MGFFRSLLRLKYAVMLFGAGYLLHSCVSSDERYRVKRVGQRPYLVDTATDWSLEISTQNFQVGSTEYRIRGLFQEPDLQTIVERLQREREAKR